VENTQFITYGNLSQSIIDEYNSYAIALIDKNPVTIEALQESMVKSVHKINKQKDQASTAGMIAVRGIDPKIHPMLVDTVDEKEQMLIDFKESVKNYKPKQAALHIGILKTRDEERIGIFNTVIEEQKQSSIIKKEREKMQKQYEKELQDYKRVLEKNHIEMRNRELKNNELLERNKEL